MATRVPEPPIITPDQWGARRPRARATGEGRPHLGVFHHTAGHAPDGHGSGRAYFHSQAIRYALALQHLHMDERGWNDSGHNFLVMRSGYICVGRWGSLSAIRDGHMVRSAHCPGQNDQPGIEHEHVSGEAMSGPQLAAAAWLWAFICDRTGIRVTQLFGHRTFFATRCPDNLEPGGILEVRGRAASILTKYGHPPAPRRRLAIPRRLKP